MAGFPDAVKNAKAKAKKKGKGGKGFPGADEKDMKSGKKC